MDVYEELVSLSEECDMQSGSLKTALIAMEAGMSTNWRNRLEADHQKHIQVTQHQPVPGPIAKHGYRLGKKVSEEEKEKIKNVLFLGAKGFMPYLEALEEAQKIGFKFAAMAVEPREGHRKGIEGDNIILLATTQKELIFNNDTGEMDRIAAILSPVYWGSADRVLVFAKCLGFLRSGGSLDILMTGEPLHGDGLSIATREMRKELVERGCPMHED